MSDFMKIMRMSFPDGTHPVQGKVFVDFEIEYKEGQSGIFKVWFPVQGGAYMLGLLRYADRGGATWVPEELANGMANRIRPLVTDIKDGMKGETNAT